MRRVLVLSASSVHIIMRWILFPEIIEIGVKNQVTFEVEEDLIVVLRQRR